MSDASDTGVVQAFAEFDGEEFVQLHASAKCAPSDSIGPHPINSAVARDWCPHCREGSPDE